MRKYIMALLFILMLCLPVAVTGLSGLFETTIDIKLEGFTKNQKKPVLSWNSFIKGDYQKDYTKWWENSFAPRGVIIKSYNQIRMDVFGESNRIIGKNDCLFEIEYIQEYLSMLPKFNFKSQENQKRLENYLKKVETVSAKLKKMDKLLLLYTTPSKCDYMAEYIPEKYMKQASPDRIRAVEYFEEIIGNYNILYLNGKEIIEQAQMDIPVFYKTGIHWSRPAEQLVSSNIMKVIQKEKYPNIRTFELEEVKQQKTSFWRDTDIEKLINVWSFPAETYYEYTTERVMPEQYGRMNILIQGDSFSEGFRRDVLENQIADNVTQVFYNSMYYDEFETMWEIKESWEDLPLADFLQETDVVIIELNEQFITDTSWGFIDYLDLCLDDPIIKQKPVYLKNMDLKGDYAAECNKSFGYYKYESDFTWAQNYSSVTLYNKAITEKGLELSFGFSEFINYENNDNLEIYINGKKIRSIKAEGGKFDRVVISADEIANDEDLYKVDLYIPKYFIPNELMGVEDYRKLAIKIEYVGEVR